MAAGSDGGGAAAGGTPVGRTYGPVAHAVTREAVDAYLEATGDDNPAYRDGGLAPPMYAAVYARDAVAEALRDEGLGLDLARLVHGGQDFAFLEPVRVGDAVETMARLAERRAAGAHEVLVLETETRRDGAVVSLGRWTLVIRGAGE